MSAKLLKLKQDRAAAFAKVQDAQKRAEAKDATPEAVKAATKEWDESLDAVAAFDAQIADEQRQADTDAAAAVARRDRTSAIQTRAGPRSQQRPTGVTAQRELAEDAPNNGFRNEREYLQAVIAHGTTGRMDARLQGLQAAAGSDEAGEFNNGFANFLIPEGFAPNLLSVAAEADPTAGRTTQLPMTSPSMSINARVDKNHATSVTGGMRFYRRAEANSVTASRTQYEQVTLKANSLMGLSFASEELLADSPVSLAALIQAGFRDELGAKLLEEKIRGTGVGQFLGVLNAPCGISIAKVSGQAAATIVLDNVLAMRARCWGYGRAVWIANHDTFPQLAKLTMPVGTGGVAMYQTSAVEDRPDMLLGRPIFYSEFASSVGANGDLILSDWSQYLEASLQGEQLSESTHVRFDTNERAFKVTVRNDGQPWWSTALTPKNGATLSPIVTLAARA